MTALAETETADIIAAAYSGIGDKGYQGSDFITPFKKPQGGELPDWQKEFNAQVNKLRAPMGAAPIQVVVRAGSGMTRALPECPDIWVHTGGACRVFAQAGGLRAVRGSGRGAPALWCVHGKATASILCGVPRHAKKETVAVGASIAHERVAGEAAGHEDAEEALFAAARAHAEAMIAWAGSEQSLALEHEQLESETMKAGFEFMRLLTQAHLDLRAARERRRDDVTDADGDARTICEDGHERVRVMMYGPVTTSRIAYRKKGKENLYPQDAELNWGQQSYSAGIIGRNAEAVATAPFGQAAAQVSAQGAIHLGKR